MANDERINRPVCSFCGKPQEQVRRLVAGPGVFICDECIELCRESSKRIIPTLPT